MQHPYAAAAPSSRGEGAARAAADRPEKERKAPKKADDSKGAGRKHAVQPKPEEQRGRPDPKVKE